MPVISTFAALSARGYGGMGSSNPQYGGLSYIGRSTALTPPITGPQAMIDDISIDSSGNVYYSIFVKGTTGNQYGYLIKTDSAGTRSWATPWQYTTGVGAYQDTYSKLVTVTSAGHVYTATSNILLFAYFSASTGASLGGQCAFQLIPLEFPAIGGYNKFGTKFSSIDCDASNNVWATTLPDTANGDTDTRGIILKYSEVAAGKYYRVTATIDGVGTKLVTKTNNVMLWSSATKVEAVVSLPLTDGSNFCFSPDPAVNSQLIVDVAVDSNDNSYVLSQITLSGTTYPVITKLDSIGGINWSKKINTSATTLRKIAVDSSDNVVIYYDSTLMKIDLDGVVVWQHTLDAGEAYAFEANNGGSIVMSLVDNSYVYTFAVPSSGRIPFPSTYTNTKTINYSVSPTIAVLEDITLTYRTFTASMSYISDLVYDIDSATSRVATPPTYTLASYGASDT